MSKLGFTVGFLFLVCMISIVSSRRPVLKKPQIRFITNFNEFHFGYYGGQNVTLIHMNDTVYVIPKNLTQATIVCNASYPITWVFHNQHLLGHRTWMLNVRTQRKAKDIFDLSTYEYSAVVDIYGDYNRLTGNYTCRHTTREEYGSSVYMFWQTKADPVFLRSKENLTVFYENGMAILPCSVSEPDTRVYIQKDSLVIRQNRSIYFDSTRGVILRDLPFPAGQYRCIRDRDPPPPEGNEFVNVEVKVRNNSQIQAPDEFQPKSNATFKYVKDSKTNRSTVVCCSNSTRAPQMIHNYCNHPITCDFRKNFVDPDVKLHKWLYHNSRRHSTGCSKATLFVHSAASIRCIGDGIDQSLQLVFGLRSFNYIDIKSYLASQNAIPVYFEWAEINPHDMMVVESLNAYTSHYRRQKFGVQDEPLYSGQVLMVLCHTSSFYFSDGLEWAVRWKNNTIQLSGGNSPIQGLSHVRYTNYYIQVTLHSDMESVMCIAPVWNTTEYVHKPFLLYVNESVLPVLAGPMEETFTWTMNDTKEEIRCEASGVPLPDFRWTKLNDFQWTRAHSNLNHTNVVNSTTNTTAFDSLQFHRVTFSTNGTYICTATNYAGKVTKTIHIYVEEPESWKTGVTIVVGSIIVISLLAFIGFMLWRLRKDHTKIQQLSNTMSYNNHDSNGGIHQTGLSADADNCDLDVPKMNSTLVH